MKLSLVLIIYRSDSSIAQKASKFCEEVLRAKNINSKRIESDFYKDEIKKYFCNLELQPNIGIVLGGDGTFLKCANALADYDIPLLSINIGGNLGFLTQEKDFLFDKSFIEILENVQIVLLLKKLQNSVKKFLKQKILNQTGLKVIFIKMKLKNIFLIQNHNQILA